MTFGEKEGSELARQLGFTGDSVKKAAQQFISIFETARKNDATMVEINPLAELENGEVMCLDAKIGLDDNAAFRHKEWAELADNSQKDAKEVEADKYELNYIALDGNVGCMVNGAGLAMSTMDIIALYGQKPANFLDVGGSAKTEQIVQAFSIITRDPNVKCILVNIFGGIMKCDVIAQGVIEAVKQLGDKLKVPIVVRLEGTNDKLGLQLLADSKLAITPASDLDDAAQKACKLVAAQ
jgi:succinyl-CoA synthetase beta subunit